MVQPKKAPPGQQKPSSKALKQTLKSRQNERMRIPEDAANVNQEFVQPVQPKKSAKPIQRKDNAESPISDDAQKALKFKPVIASVPIQVIVNNIRSSSTVINPEFISVKSITWGDGTKKSQITFTNQECYDSVIKILLEKEIPYHSFSQTKKKVFVLKGFDLDGIGSDILTELKAAKVPAVKVTTIVKYSNKSRSVHLVTFDDDDLTVSDLNHKFSLIGIVRVSWEPQHPSKKKPTQCHNCQQWGHSSLNCHHPAKCVKCAGDHPTSQCTRQKATKDPPKCANCGGAHTASFQGCEFAMNYKQLIQSSRSRRSPQLTGRPGSNYPSFSAIPREFPSLPQSQNQPHYPSASWRLENARRQPDIPSRRPPMAWRSMLIDEVQEQQAGPSNPIQDVVSNQAQVYPSRETEPANTQELLEDVEMPEEMVSLTRNVPQNLLAEFRQAQKEFDEISDIKELMTEFITLVRNLKSSKDRADRVLILSQFYGLPQNGN